MQCHVCGSKEVEMDPAQGNAVCVGCGTVLEENTIVSELTFGENASGGGMMIGQVISQDRSRATMNPFGFSRRRNPDQSRQVTLANARRRISAVAAAVRLNEHHVDAAHRWYTLALQHHFTKGRKIQIVSSACLYIVCRQEKTSHMLLDFSDALRMNVYTIGSTFLKLTRLLNLDVPLVDPSLFVGRFAAKLEFGEKTQLVANTALRLVARMKRDWIQTGRNPAGICGACLLISARMHDFNRTQKQIIQVARVCDATLRKRLTEFASTATANLTPEEFQGVWLEQENDPPAFQKATLKRRKKLQLLRAKELEAEQTDPKQKDMVSFSGSIDLDMEFEVSLQEAQKKHGGGKEGAGGLKGAKGATSSLDDMTDAAMEKDLVHHLNEQAGTPSCPAKPAENADVNQGPRVRLLTTQEILSKTSDSLSDLEDLDDNDLDTCLLEDTEVAEKTKLWMNMNEDYLAKQKAKEEEEAMNKALGITKRKYKKRKKTSIALDAEDMEDGAEGGTAMTPAEAAKEMLSRTKLSKRINYEALDHLFDQGDDPAVPGTDAVASNAEREATEKPLENVDGEVMTPPASAEAPGMATDLQPKEAIKFDADDENDDVLPLMTPRPTPPASPAQVTAEDEEEHHTNDLDEDPLLRERRERLRRQHGYDSEEDELVDDIYDGGSDFY